MIGGSWLGLALTTRTTMNRFLLTLGIVFIIAGLSWPWLKRAPLFHLPGDIIIDRPGFKVMFPITTMLILSAALSLLA
jgi:ribose/xylose/arabinose/galactoside ABC-type transport system permease subunit